MSELPNLSHNYMRNLFSMSMFCSVAFIQLNLKSSYLKPLLITMLQLPPLQRRVMESLASTGTEVWIEEAS